MNGEKIFKNPQIILEIIIISSIILSIGKQL